MLAELSTGTFSIFGVKLNNMPLVEGIVLILGKHDKKNHNNLEKNQNLVFEKNQGCVRSG